MKLKIGDKVRIRTDLHEERYGADSVVREMLKFAGKTATIKYINGEIGYLLDIAPFNWTDEMFEDAEKPVIVNGVAYV